ncbi:RNA polymerase-ADP-ribosyltransferase Alt [Yersinia phage vB_YenM_TG1]|uniref:NAD(+)--arginine ADP-ribosyltransferase n=1 Tax=Yersinia phage vB_YenM_TG1 TaxID=1589265 RepID=A0A0B5A4M4_9CAUD|nr:Alt-like RNA polymerase ADP-ribosyltransferase [Yersinia phage vB_YenM_TG1]AJD82006.1 RNA polymerase-ADP-ribosyltransferase Alt [Yersinia phage vB_YenM_TG1]
MTQLFTEVFDSDSEKNYPVVNLNPKDKVPQIWAVKVPGNENLVARMVSYTSEGDAIKKVKQGDKYAHVILMSLSEKGTPAELKGGLGSDPIGALNTIFDTVYADVKKLKMDAILFRFPAKKMKGQERILQRIMDRLVMARTGGRFKVLDALYHFTGKHAYILIYRKSRPLEDISGIPGINADLYTKVESSVGDVYVSKESGVQVTKDEAIAGSIDAIEKKRSDRTAITRTKINRRALAQSQSLESDSFVLKDWEELDASAVELSKPATGELIKDAAAFEAITNSSYQKNKVAKQFGHTITNCLDLFSGYTLSTPERVMLSEDIALKFSTGIKDNSTTSVEALKLATKIANDAILVTESKWRENAMLKQISDLSSVEQKQANVDKEWIIYRASQIQNMIKSYSAHISNDIRDFTIDYSPEYSLPEKRAIKEYVGSGYTDINGYLLGRYKPEEADTLDEDDVVKAIKNLDSAFINGEKLPKDYTLYRSQTMRGPIFDALKTNRKFYFRNYVSTSLYPIIFGGWQSNVAVALADEDIRKDINVQVPGLDSTDEYVDPNASKVSGYTRIYIGWAITGADKINVVYPGKLSIHTNEMEVILPRGTIVEITSITDASYYNTRKTITGMGQDKHTNTKMIQAEILTTEQLSESSIVYDGDMLFETGELVVYSGEEDEVSIDFNSFMTMSKKRPVKEVMQLLASAMDLEDVPPKFK